MRPTVKMWPEILLFLDIIAFPSLRTPMEGFPPYQRLFCSPWSRSASSASSTASSLSAAPRWWRGAWTGVLWWASSEALQSRERWHLTWPASSATASSSLSFRFQQNLSESAYWFLINCFSARPHFGLHSLGKRSLLPVTFRHGLFWKPFLMCLSYSFPFF